MLAAPVHSPTSVVLGNDDVAEALRLLYELPSDAPDALRAALRRLIVLSAAYDELSARTAALEAQSAALTGWVERARVAMAGLPAPIRRMIPELPAL